MKDAYPKYYESFRCIADKCPDTCCTQWDVVIDDETYNIYRSLSGNLGEKIRKSMTIDGDGDRIFINKNGRCPFFKENGLCGLITEGGEGLLCKTCKSFPRLELDYTDFCEHMLSFACPEAARLILTSENAYEAFDEDNESLSGNAFMKLLLRGRRKTADLLRDRSVGVSQRLENCLKYNLRLQQRLFPEYVCESAGAFSDSADPGEIIEFYKSLDIMTEHWKILLDGARPDKIKNKIERFGEYFEKIALYYVYRYYLAAVDCENVLNAVKKACCKCILLSSLCEKEEDVLRLACLYSKEAEHSYENNEAIDLELCTSRAFSCEALIKIINPHN